MKLNKRVIQNEDHLPQREQWMFVCPLLFFRKRHVSERMRKVKSAKHALREVSRNWLCTYVSSARTAQKTSLPLLRVLSLPGKQRVHRAFPCLHSWYLTMDLHVTKLNKLCPDRSKVFLFPTASRPTQIPIQWGPWDLSPVAKLQGHEADRSSPSRAEIKKGGPLPPLPPMYLRHNA